jgi:hypothetical protein
MKVTKCRSCPQAIVWLPTEKGKMMPVNAQTTRQGDRRYDPSIGHISHYASCPAANKHSNATKRARHDDERVYDEDEFKDAPKRKACYVPENLPPAVDELYQLCDELDLNRSDVRVILRHQYDITGDPRGWDTDTINRAREAIEQTAHRRDDLERVMRAARIEEKEPA